MNTPMTTSPRGISGAALAAAEPRPVLACPSRGLDRQVPEPDQIVGGRDEEDVPLDPIAAAMAQLAQPAHRLHSAYDLFDAHVRSGSRRHGCCHAVARALVVGLVDRIVHSANDAESFALPGLGLRADGLPEVGPRGTTC